MKLIYEAEVYLVAATHQKEECREDTRRFLKDHNVEKWTSDADNSGDRVPEIGGRLCYMSFGAPRPGGNKAYLERIIESKHGSVLEHPSWTFIFTGVSRTLTHELVRHRIGVAYSQLSQRYVDESTAEYVVPWELQKEVNAGESLINNLKNYMTGAEGLLSQWEYEMMRPNPLLPTELLRATPQEIAGLRQIRSMERSHRDYSEQVEYLLQKVKEESYRNYSTSEGDMALNFEDWYGILTQDSKTELRKKARQAARSVLPNATETKIMVTMNARAARHMIEMRCSRHAEPEIRRLFGKVWEVLGDESPNLFMDYTKVDLPDGTFEVTTPNRKV